MLLDVNILKILDYYILINPRNHEPKTTKVASTVATAMLLCSIVRAIIPSELRPNREPIIPPYMLACRENKVSVPLAQNQEIT